MIHLFQNMTSTLGVLDNINHCLLHYISIVLEKKGVKTIWPRTLKQIHHEGR